MTCLSKQNYLPLSSSLFCSNRLSDVDFTQVSRWDCQPDGPRVHLRRSPGGGLDMGETRSVPGHSGQDQQWHVGRRHPPGETDECNNLELRVLNWAPPSYMASPTLVMWAYLGVKDQSNLTRWAKPNFWVRSSRPYWNNGITHRT